MGERFTAASLAALPEIERARFWATLSDAEICALGYDWGFWARDAQLPPHGDWLYWFIQAGRGFGKTRCGAETVRQWVEGKYTARIALIGPTAADVRDVMIEGESGILSTSPPWNKPEYVASRRKVVWPNGVQAFTYSAEEPERLRGPQHGAAWCDEIAAWKYPTETWDMMLFGLRLGLRPRAVITSTPKPIEVVKRLAKDPDCIVTRGTTYDNLANLAAPYRSIIRQYEGTRLGRQELEAEILSDNPFALWKRARIDETRVKEAPDLTRIVIAVDPPATSGEKADECGIVAIGIDDGKPGYEHGYVLGDYTSHGDSPEGWAEKVITAYRAHEADAIIAEVNQGGDMVGAVIAQVDRKVPVRSVRATRGKVVRAEPVALLYEQGRVHHVGAFGTLEDQMCEFASDFDPKTAGYSPDRVDALVWGLTDLMIARKLYGFA